MLLVFVQIFCNLENMFFQGTAIDSNKKLIDKIAQQTDWSLRTAILDAPTYMKESDLADLYKKEKQKAFEEVRIVLSYKN